MWLKEYYEVLGAAIKKSKEYTDSEVAKVRTKFTVVASYSDLPDPGRTDTIYLVPQTGTPHTYDQYIYEDGQYVDIGDTTIDLDNYATDDELAAGLALKVDKVTGKGLSTNDYTTAEKTKLAGIETGAQKNITPDASLDKTSTNAVQNKAVVEGLDELRTDIWEDEVAQGNPIYLELVAEQKAKDTKITFEPTQDFNGYDYPWPAGGGKNLIETNISNIKNLNTTGVWNENSYTLNDVTFTIQLDNSNNITGILATGLATANSSFIIGKSPLNVSCILNGCPSDGSLSSYLLRAYHATSASKNYDDTGNGVKYTPTANDYDVRIVVYEGFNADNLLFKPMVRLSTEEDSSYVPYTNICPITGKSSISVKGTGKNLYENKGESVTMNGAIYTVNADKTISVSGTPNGSGTFNAGRMEVSSSLGTVYCGNISKATNVAWAGITLYDSTPTIIASLHQNELGTMYSVDLSQYPTVKYISLGFKRAQNGVAMSGVIEPMITTSLPQVYEPYQSSNIITIQLGNTYYGGTLDVDNGVLSVNMAMVDLGSLDWSISVTTFTSDLNNVKIPINNSTPANILCEQYIASSINGMGNNKVAISQSGKLWVRDERYTDAAAFKTAMNGVQLVYELTTPTTIQLTPAEVNLLKGANTIWTDGKDLTITYNYGQIATKKDLEDYVPWTMVDQEMDPTSENPVSNKAVSGALSSLSTALSSLGLSVNNNGEICITYNEQ